MVWYNFIYVCVAVNSLFLVTGSIVEVNDTVLESWPPLFVLDEWAGCQRPGDVYCMVDAALVGNGSPLLRQLRDYSRQSLKHYNRTQIHRGVCVSRCSVTAAAASNGTWSEAQYCVNQSVTHYGLQAQVLSVDLCTTADAAPDMAAAYILAIVTVVFLTLVFFATSLHLLGERCGNVGNNKYVTAFSLKNNWKIIMYDRRKPRTDGRMRDVTSMEGIRFLGIQGVIFSHVLFMFIYSYIDNPQFVENMYDQFAWKVIFNSPLWLQSFFSLSGFLTAYTVLITAESKPFTFVRALLAVINRWIRLTPVAVYMLWVTMAWFPLLGAGPQWAWLVTREAQHCSERWWYHLFYVHNHLPLGKICMGHTWYLAADMQLHVIGVLVLLVLVRYRRAALPVLTGFLLASSLAAGLVTYWNQLTPVFTAQSPEALRMIFAGSKIMSLLYLPSWMNVPGYACGVATAFLLHHSQDKGLKLNQNKWFGVAFHLALPLAGAVVASGALFLSDEAPSVAGAALYAAVDRLLVSVCFNIFMFGCFVQCKSGVRNLLEWRGFHPLGRLSYCAFLVHFLVLRLTLASTLQLTHVTIFSMVTLLITTLVLTLVAAVPLCLFLELPTVQLWKAIVEGDKPVRRKTLATQHNLKPIDPIENIRRSE